MEWVQLDHENAIKFMKSVENASFQGLFSPDLSQVHVRNLNFFRDTQHITLENHNSEPPLCLEFLKSGPVITYLDGSTTPFDTFCALGLLILTSDTVIDYLEFNCRMVIERPNNIYLLKNYEKIYIPGQSSLDFQFDRHRYTEKDISFTKKEDNSGYIVQAPFVFDGKIDPAQAIIGINGTVTINRRARS